MSERIEPPRFLDELGRHCAQLRRALPAEPVPCFAHLRIESVDPAGATRVRDLLLGFRTFSSDSVTLINWQTAPLAEVFFSCREGEEYELSVGGRELGGTVLARSLLTFQGGELVEVETTSGRFCRRPPSAGQPDAPWRWAGPAPALLQPQRGSGRAAPPWSPQALDPEQRRAVELPQGRALLVLGEAGCGKTTVALHRLAALHRAAQGAGRPLRSLLLVPAASAGLRHLCEALLGRLGVGEAEVEVEVFDRWAGRQARRAFPQLPPRESQDVPAGVVAIKRHPGLLPVLKQLAARRRSAALRRAGASRADLLHLFGDRALLEQLTVVPAAAPAQSSISGEAVRQVLEHTRVQFNPTTEEASPHIDADRLVTVDGRRIDEGTPTEDAGSIDAEDYAVLFALAALRAAPGSAGPSPTQYDCVVVDEAQEFAPIELMLIGRALRPGGTLIVAGDEAQQVDPSAYFAGFAALMQHLRAPDFAAVELAISYRCPPAVTALARTLRQPGPAAAIPLAASDAVVQAGFPSECHLLARLGDALRALREAEPAVTVAVICRTAPAAERLARLLARGVHARLARDGEFRFAAPIEVTCVQEVKGLEFDYVIIPDATALAYPEDAAARRALYVAVTRAAQQLLLCGIGTFSPLLPGRAAPADEPAAS